MKKIFAATLVSIFVTSPALADNSGKFYLGGDLGIVSYTDMYATISGARYNFPTSGAISLTAGYQFNQTLAMELGFTSLGKSTISTPSGALILQTSSVTLAAVGSLPLSPEFDLFGKLGFSNNSATEELTGSLIFSDGSKSATASYTDLLLGFGARYHVSPQVGIHAQYQNFGNLDKNASGSISMISVGATYAF